MVDLLIRLINRELIRRFKRKCIICGESEKCCLEIHHIYDKKFNISQEVGYKDTNDIKKELKKCVCVCSNCHKKIHNGVISDSVLLRFYNLFKGKSK